MKLLENLVNYDDKNLHSVIVGERHYRTLLGQTPLVSIGFACGTTSCNDRLAQTMYDARHYFGNQSMKMMAQKEIVDKFGTDGILELGKKTTHTSLFKSQVGTRDILEFAAEEIEKDKMPKDRILYVAHPCHIYRVMKMGEKLGMKGIPFIEEDVKWSDPDDIHSWTTSPWKQAPREILARAVLMYRGHF